MKVLHTSDWHLGIKLDNQYRDEEHKEALQWLSNLIKSEGVEVLIIAGDVFDVYTPSNSAQNLYYNFLKSLVNTACQHIIIVAGNHDSPNLLAAAKELLALLNIYVVANISKDLNAQILPLYDQATQNLKAVIAAVPYLSEGVLRSAHKGEDAEARHEQIKAAIIQHYEDLAQLISKYDVYDVPYIATGHLFVAGGDAGSKNHLTYLGFSDLIPASAFPKKFDYIALGHLHKAHPVNKEGNIRYSGSLIPLDFSESEYKHQVYIIAFEGKNIKDIASHKVAIPRNLIYKQGRLEEIINFLQSYPTINDMNFKPKMKTWLKLELQSEQGFMTNLKEQLEPYTLDKNIEILGEPLQRTVYRDSAFEEDQMLEIRSLESLSVEEVFEMCMEAQNIAEEVQDDLKEDLRALQTWWDEQQRNK